MSRPPSVRVETRLGLLPLGDCFRAADTGRRRPELAGLTQLFTARPTPTKLLGVDNHVEKGMDLSANPIRRAFR